MEISCSVFGLRRNPAFSRASRSPALRRLAKLPPLASARKQHSTNQSKARELKPACALSERTDAACGGGRQPKRRSTAPGGCGPCNSANCKKQSPKKTTANNASLRIAKTAEPQKPAQNPPQKQLFLINTPAPLRRQRTAESTDHAGASRSLHHSRHSDCFQRKTVWQNKLPPITERQISEPMAVQCFRILPSCPGIPAEAPPGRGNAATQRKYAVCGS